ncbi:MAG: putative toxin-antitoxin system toxin component, PIN family [Firmicutes bacterium HGW-Firmicutes-8]|nr:MAG: putative toxin-antitoxin system toxin component, PIN family [Firmicutes bacterium HGW-Firmicutes-8]
MKGKSKGFRVFIDSNVLISAIRSGKSASGKLLELLIEKHYLVLCSYNITEVSKVIAQRFPDRLVYWDSFLSCQEYELVYTPSDPTNFKAPYIRDEKDIPVLVSAVIAQPDILITGDLDFHTREIREYFAVYTPADFLKCFGDNK